MKLLGVAACLAARSACCTSASDPRVTFVSRPFMLLGLVPAAFAWSEHPVVTVDEPKAVAAGNLDHDGDPDIAFARG